MQPSTCLLLFSTSALLPLLQLQHTSAGTESELYKSFFHVFTHTEKQVNPNYTSFHSPPLPFMSCWKMKYFQLCFVSFTSFCLPHVLMSEMAVCVSAICSHGNASCTLLCLHNVGAVRALPQHCPSVCSLKANEPFPSCSRHITHPDLFIDDVY